MPYLSLSHTKICSDLCVILISSKTDYSVPPSCRDECEQNRLCADSENFFTTPSQEHLISHHFSSTWRWRFTERKVGCCYGTYWLRVSSRYVVALFQKSLHSPETSSPWNPRVSPLQVVHKNPLSSHTFHPGSLSFPNKLLGRSIFFGAMCCSVR